MNYHIIKTDDMLNGDGLRVVLFLSGCNIHCKGCHNPETWDFNSGMLFDDNAKQKVFNELKKEHIKGVTISGGNPLEYQNLSDVYDLLKEIKIKFPQKDIWLYTGYELTDDDFDTTVDVGWDNGLLLNYILAMCNIVVDGAYIEKLRDVNYPWAGSTNQRIIDVKKTIKNKKITLYKKDKNYEI